MEFQIQYKKMQVFDMQSEKTPSQNLWISILR